MKRTLGVTVGLLSLFLMTSACTHHGGHHGQHRAHWKTMDTDSNQKISESEWSEMFNRIDKNGDGKITRDEMHAHHKKHRKGCGMDKCDKDHCPLKGEKGKKKKDS